MDYRAIANLDHRTEQAELRLEAVERLLRTLLLRELDDRERGALVAAALDAPTVPAEVGARVRVLVEPPAQAAGWLEAWFRMTPAERAAALDREGA